MHRAATVADRGAVRALRLEVLRAQGDIGPRDDERIGDEHDAAPNSIVFLLTRHASPVGTTRTSLSAPPRRRALPAEATYPSELAALGPASTIVEASLTLVRVSSQVDPTTVLLHLAKAHMLACAAGEADWLVAAVRESQIGFYRRMFNMEILSGAEAYGELAAPRVLMGLDYRSQAALLFRRMPALAVTDDDVREFAESGRVAFAEPRRDSSSRRAPPHLPAGR